MEAGGGRSGLIWCYSVVNSKLVFVGWMGEVGCRINMVLFHG